MKRKSLSTKERLRMFTLHGGICHLCSGKIDGTREAWEISHDIPLELGGADDDDNRKPAHWKCHRTHTAEVDQPNIARAKRREANNIGAKAPSTRSLPCSRKSPWKKKVTGEVVPRR